MSRTAVKICGITNAADAKLAVAAGADALGLVFYAPSKRYLSIEQAKRVVAEIPPFVSVVGLFVDASKQEVESVLSELPLSLLQFHGNETSEYCESFARPYIKALKFKVGNNSVRHQQAGGENRNSLASAMAEHSTARGFLLDTYDERAAGGTGKQFDWAQIPANLSRPIILAGGLNPANVAGAIDQVKPYAVDVSSGVESAPGVKSAELIASFISSVQTT